jgi:hypothetical protein
VLNPNPHNAPRLAGKLFCGTLYLMSERLIRDDRDIVPVMNELVRPMSRAQFIGYNILASLAIGGIGAAVDVEAGHDIATGHDITSNVGLVAFGSAMIIGAAAKFGKDAWSAHRTRA